MATITGSGTPQAATATVSGTGEREITGTGTPQAETATAAGFINESGSGLLISFYQEVILKGSGSIIEFEQSVESPGGDEGTLIAFEQTVKTGSGKFRGLLLS